MKHSPVAKTIQLPNGQEVLDLYNQEFTSQAAIVSLDIIKRLASKLSSVKFETVKFDTCEALSRTTNLEDFVSIMQEETNFHRTVNLITTIDMTQGQEDIINN